MDEGALNPALGAINLRHEEFWRNQRLLLEQRLADDPIRDAAIAIITDEAARAVPIYYRKCFYWALETAVQQRQMFVKAFGRKGGQAEKGDSLQELIERLVSKSPRCHPRLENRPCPHKGLRRHRELPDIRAGARAIFAQAERFCPQNILIEDKASGTQLIQELQAEGVFGVKLYKPPNGADKVMRLHAQSTGFENGLVFLPRKAPWLNDYVNELISFPGSKYDDQVDSTTQALDYLRSIDSAMEVWTKLGGG